jgi:hypothetical protein
MNRQPNSLKGRVVRLESLCARRPRDSRFFMVWGKDNADIERKLHAAEEGGELASGDRFDAKIWTGSGTPPLPRWTKLDEMSREELVIIAGGEDREDRRLHPSIACQWTDADLSDFYANSANPGDLIECARLKTALLDLRPCKRGPTVIF